MGAAENLLRWLGSSLDASTQAKFAGAYDKAGV